MSPSEPELWIVVRNWRRFQHYTDRQPPWIKTYLSLMHDDAYFQLSEHRALMLHRLWLEYASSSARLRLDTRSLSRRLSMRVTKADLEALNHAGFITFSASTPLAPRYQNASDTRVGGELQQTEEQKQEQSQIQNPSERKLDTSRANGAHDLAPLDYLAELEHAREGGEIF